MVYHGRMERSTTWVADYVKWLGLELATGMNQTPQIWPIVQAHNVPDIEFEEVLRGGLQGVSTGVMMFTSGAVANDPEKLKIMKAVYTQKK